jgi:hypothetical protein
MDDIAGEAIDGSRRPPAVVFAIIVIALVYIAFIAWQIALTPASP